MDSPAPELVLTLVTGEDEELDGLLWNDCTREMEAFEVLADTEFDTPAVPMRKGSKDAGILPPPPPGDPTEPRPRSPGGRPWFMPWAAAAAAAIKAALGIPLIRLLSSALVREPKPLLFLPPPPLL